MGSELSDQMETIGERIRERREAIDLSREGLAFKSGVAHKTIERIEGGHSIPRRATLAAIERALDGCEAEQVTT
jgi:transcriptional regulator with XRE-family HTH domain